MKSFWSIERAIAFVVAPIASALAGIATQLVSTGQLASTHAPGASYALSGSAVVSTAAMFWKWLHGRQNLQPAFKTLDNVAGEIGHYVGEIPPDERAKLLAEVEGLISNALGVSKGQIARVEAMVTQLHASIADASSTSSSFAPTIVTEVPMPPADWGQNDAAPSSSSPGSQPEPVATPDGPPQSPLPAAPPGVAAPPPVATAAPEQPIVGA